MTEKENYDGWQIIEPLGEGGQGIVYKARSPGRVQAIRKSLTEITHKLRNIADLSADEFLPEAILKDIVDIGSVDQPEQLGALKVFKIPDGDAEEQAKALARLQTEVKALMELKHPAVLKFIHAPHMAAKEHFLVTEYHPRGTLDRHLLEFKSRALESLEAFRPLVEGIVAIHAKGAIHRDVKTQNIFVATDGRLVLGDFGIVFYRGSSGSRYTETFGERVGSHYWMAPWAYEPKKLALETVNPALDIYPLAKVLWSMVAGQDGFGFWEYDIPANNLEFMFPNNNRSMQTINKILAKCVVRSEQDCLQSASELLSLVDAAIDEIKTAGQRPEGNRPWRCRICGKGHYVPESMRTRIQYEVRPDVLAGAFAYTVFICDFCKHCEFFRQ